MGPKGGLFKFGLNNVLAANNMLFCAFNVQTLLWFTTRPIPIHSQLSSTDNAATQKLSLSGKMPSQVSKVLGFVKLSSNAFTPTKGSDKAAGFDLKSAYNYVIAPRSKEMVKTDIQIKLPEGCYGRIAPRSGLAWKNGIDVGAGVVDEDYRGDIRVILFNHSDEPFTIQAGDRIAQLVCEQIFYPEIQEVKELDETSRGGGGFGSTGKN